MTRNSYSEFETGIIENVEKHGCQVNFIFDPDDVEPDFSYSIGFSKSVQQPEIIVFGLPKNLMHSLVNRTLEQCRNGLQLKDGAAIDGLLDGHQCIAKSVHPSQIIEHYFNSAIWFNRTQLDTQMTEAVQIVWPGAYNGKFPWDADCSEDVIEAQPALYEPRIAA